MFAVCRLELDHFKFITVAVVVVVAVVDDDFIIIICFGSIPMGLWINPHSWLWLSPFYFWDWWSLPQLPKKKQIIGDVATCCATRV